MVASPGASESNGLIDGRFAGRLGATLYGVSGLVVLASAPLLDGVDRTRLAVLALSGIAVGPAVLLLPWERHGRLLAAVLVATGQVHLIIAEWLIPGAVQHFLPLYVLSYLYAGMTQPPRWSLALAPLTVVNFFQIGAHGTENIVDLVVTLPVGVAAGEVVAWLVRREHEELEQVAKVLEATNQLVAAESTDEATQVIGELTQDLAGSDLVAVFVADVEAPSRFVVRMRSPELEPLGPISIDIDREVSAVGVAVRGRHTVAITDARASDFVARRLVEAADVGSSVLVPLFDRGTPVGVITLVWHRAGERLAASPAQIVELVAAEAGPILNRLRERDRLNLEAETDPLTGLSNRRTFNRALDQSEPGDALVMLDLDRFKLVNDEHGHAAGDDCLRTLAACLRKVARERDCVARFGGEEFAVILPGASDEGVRSFLARLRELWTDAAPLTTFSSGYAVRGKHEGPLFTLGRADRALYDAKRYGRNTDVAAEPPDAVA
jgi:diguanylate cyclase (GGDEF)-like protein